MELVKKKIHMDRIGQKADTQIVLEEDINVSDNKPDVKYLLTNKGEIQVEEMRIADQAVNIRGKMKTSVLYLTEIDGMCDGMDAVIPFEEKIFMDDVKNSDTVGVRWCIEDLTVGLINSRKLSIQAVVSFVLEKEDQTDEEAAVDLYHDEPVEYRKCVVPVSQPVMHKKDIYRIKEEMELTGNLPNIFRIVWNSITYDHVEIHPMDDVLSIQGEMKAFFLYEGEGDSEKTLWYENTVPFSGTLECHGSDAGMAADISYRPVSCNVEVRQDFDGEDRVFCIESVLELDIHLYEQENVEFLSDVYGVEQEIETVTMPMQIKKMLPTTVMKQKVAEKVKVQNPEMPVYQLLHSEGEAQIDETEVVEDGVLVSGTLVVNTLYLCAGEINGIYASKNSIPFSGTIDAEGIGSDSIVRIKCSVEQLTVTASGSDELDIKAGIQFTPIVFGVTNCRFITDIHVEPLDMNKMSSLPGMVIYVVGEEDTLWDIGKRYYVPIESIKEVNELTSDVVKKGDKLLIVK